MSIDMKKIAAMVAAAGELDPLGLGFHWDQVPGYLELNADDRRIVRWARIDQDTIDNALPGMTLAEAKIYKSQPSGKGPWFPVGSPANWRELGMYQPYPQGVSIW